jgi:hypothetical protein
MKHDGVMRHPELSSILYLTGSHSEQRQGAVLRGYRGERFDNNWNHRRRSCAKL